MKRFIRSLIAIVMAAVLLFGNAFAIAGIHATSSEQNQSDVSYLGSFGKDTSIKPSLYVNGASNRAVTALIALAELAGDPLLFSESGISDDLWRYFGNYMLVKPAYAWKATERFPTGGSSDATVFHVLLPMEGEGRYTHIYMEYIKGGGGAMYVEWNVKPEITSSIKSKSISQSYLLKCINKNAYHGIKFSANGADKDTIKLVQQALNDAGYDCGSVDGSIGNKTKNQIKAYRQDHGLEVATFIAPDLLAAMGIQAASPIGGMGGSVSGSSKSSSGSAASAPAPARVVGWVCPLCGTTGQTGDSCSECGMPKPADAEMTEAAPAETASDAPAADVSGAEKNIAALDGIMVEEGEEEAAEEEAPAEDAPVEAAPAAPVSSGNRVELMDFLRASYSDVIGGIDLEFIRDSGSSYFRTDDFSLWIDMNSDDVVEYISYSAGVAEENYMLGGAWIGMSRDDCVAQFKAAHPDYREEWESDGEVNFWSSDYNRRVSFVFLHSVVKEVTVSQYS